MKNWQKRFELTVFKFFYPIKTLHKDRVPEGKAVIVSNHLRAIDPCCLHDVHLYDMNFISKKELFKNKLIGKFFRRYGAMPIDRENPSLQSMLGFVRVLRNNQKLVIFAEGTRNKKGTKIQEIKSGAGSIAVMAKAPIVPVTIFEHERLFRKTYIYVGEPIELSAFYNHKLDEQAQKQIDQIIYNKLLENQAKLDKYMLKVKNKKRLDNKKRAVKVKKCK